MKIPKTTDEKPYIEFRFDKKGRLHLRATSNYWGGRYYGFSSSDGSKGNSCPPKELSSYIKTFKARKIKAIEKKIKALQSELNEIKSGKSHFDCKNSICEIFDMPLTPKHN